MNETEAPRSPWKNPAEGMRGGAEIPVMGAESWPALVEVRPKGSEVAAAAASDSTVDAVPAKVKEFLVVLIIFFCFCCCFCSN